MGRKEADEPKLTLQLSGTTFLDTAVLDAFTGRTLYIAETRGRDTYLLLITQDGQAKLQTASQVHWPKTKAAEGPSRIRIQMGSGRWWESEQFLKYGSVFTYATIFEVVYDIDRIHLAHESSICPDTHTNSSGKKSAQYTM